MKHLYIIILLSICFTACKKEQKQDLNSCAFLGGEIINPSDRYVIISKENNVLDTVTLDKKNRFLFKINPVDPGLYTFSHGGEIQMIFLEPNDSIIFRLNNLDFDESLVFTGRGAKENNYLINLFLKNEEVNHKILKMSQMAPKKFEHELDSIKHAFQKHLNKFESKYNTSPLFNEIAQANIDYNFYAQKELYPFTCYRNTELKNFEALPEDFYDYRSKIDYNNEKLKNYFPYYNFLKYHFNNIALQKHFCHSSDSIFNNKSLDYNLDKIQLIDSLVTSDSIKNPLLKFAAFRYINSSNNVDDYTPFLNSFLKKSTSKKNNKQIKTLIESLIELKPGNTLPNTLVTNNQGKEIHTTDFIKGPTAIYFWSFNMENHFIESHKKIEELRKKYPEIDFVAINIDKNEANWINYLKSHHYPTKNEYHFIHPDISKQILALNSINRVMLINKNSTIVNSNANMFSKHFEVELLGLINQ
ncbi:thioredoxin-like domain-containing protein [Formosa sp. L2A11]|uniref:TlpA family protein disulfide reductase n=1 Tax=Formosa sp. L2A11 TaxID=2686363 RepID=UPI00131DBB21|nr:thioredoxin-like domain-containing protein [Formosa sp. L2A11]